MFVSKMKELKKKSNKLLSIRASDVRAMQCNFDSYVSSFVMVLVDFASQLFFVFALNEKLHFINFQAIEICCCCFHIV